MTNGDFSHLIGNEKIKKHLSCLLNKEKLHHTLLFTGIEGIGKSLFAKVFAEQIVQLSTHNNSENKNAQKHPDIHIYQPEGKLRMHTMHSLRLMQQEVHLPAYQAAVKVFIIEDAERMYAHHANILLKTLEEPPPHTFFILLTHRKAALLTTILSRCQLVYFQPIEQTTLSQYIVKQYAVSEWQSQMIAMQAQGSLGRAIFLLEQTKTPHRSEIIKICALCAVENFPLMQEIMQNIIKQIENAKAQIEETAKQQIQEEAVDVLSAWQQQEAEKEIEKIGLTFLENEMQNLFFQILSWYRDLHILLLTRRKDLLYNRDYVEEIEQAVQRGHIPDLKKVISLVEENYLSFQKSTPLLFCLENIFLQLL